MISEPETVLARLAAGEPLPDRVLIVAAHPDDETIGMGAQLCRLNDALLLHVTDGAPRDGRDAAAYGFADCAAYAAARRTELDAALAAGEASQLRRGCLGIPDQQAAYRLAELTQHIAKLLGSERPTAVFTHAYEGGHPDHDATAFAVHAACRRLVQAPAIIEMALYHRRENRLVTGRFLNLSDTPSRRRPGCGVPLADAPLTLALEPADLARKQRMIDAFTTQRWLLQQFDMTAERFRAAPDYDFTQPPHPGTLYYETLGWPITGPDWRGAARRALDELGLTATA